MVAAITIRGIIGATAVILVSFVVVKLIRNFSIRKQKRILSYLYREGWITYCGLGIVLFCIFSWVYSYVNDGSVGFLQMFLITPLPLMLGLNCLLIGINWRIYVYEDRFVYQNMFGKKHEYMYNDIDGIRPISIGGYQLIIGKKKITIDFLVCNTSILEHKIEEIFNKK